MSFIEFSAVAKEYQVGELTISAVSNCNFTIEQGSFVVVLGPSGAGKTTLLNLLGGMDSVTSGTIVVDNVTISNLTKKQLVNYRRDAIGFVFQFYNLIENLTALENVSLAGTLTKDPLDAKAVLTLVGLQHRLHNFPSQLSGGEQQRVSIARAIAKNPKLLLCDEPTGALDSDTGKRILTLLRDHCQKTQTTTIIITHNAAIAQTADTIIRVNDGTIHSIIENKNPIDPKEITW